jgi:hypothetical protein
MSQRIFLTMVGSDFDNNFIFLPSVGASEAILLLGDINLV